MNRIDPRKDYYSALGVMSSAEDIVIHGAYRALAQRYHPDRFEGSPEEANERMTEINEAYGILSDASRRADYDRMREGNGFALVEEAPASDEIPQKPPAPYEVEVYRAFAEKLRDWNYDQTAIQSVLVTRGVPRHVAEYLARLVISQ